MKRSLAGPQGGFTLIELVVTFLIIAVLAATAYPMYQEYVRKARRAEAMSALLDGAQKLERYYSAHGTYLDGANLAAVFTTAIPATGSAYYTIDAAAADVGTYRLRATATGLMEGDKCGNFEITQSGSHELSNNTADVGECWRR